MQPPPSMTTTPPTPDSAPPDTAPVAPTAPPVAKGDYPYGIPIPGKPGYVYSPFTPNRPVDVKGFAPGTEVKDPYTTETRIFLVP